MHLFWGWRLEFQAGGGGYKESCRFGWPPKTGFRPQADTSKRPSLIIYNILFLELHCPRCQRDPSQMIHPFKTSSNISCLEIKQQKGIQGGKLNKDILNENISVVILPS